MSLREFTDTDGATWAVWEVEPSPNPGRPAGSLAVPDHLQQGWLAFQHGRERRRLAPVPDGWTVMSRDELTELLASAVRID